MFVLYSPLSLTPSFFPPSLSFVSPSFSPSSSSRQQGSRALGMKSKANSPPSSSTLTLSSSSSSLPSSSSSSLSISSPYNYECGVPLYQHDQIPLVYKEPYILSGYRKPDSSYVECLRYIFTRHNDVWNFWSHFLPLWVWIPWLFILSYRYNFTDPFYFPLLCFWLGGCSYVLFSSLAHLFGNKSFTVRTVCFMLDYLGISIYCCGGGISSLFYQQPISSPLLKYETTFIIIHMILCLNATVFSSLSRFYWVNYRFFIRAMSYFPCYISCIIPFVLRFLVCVSTGEDCLLDTLPLHFLSIFFSCALLFFFVTKIPERFAPGKFDIHCQSHTLFHLSAVLLTTTQMYMFPLDAEARKESLLTKVNPTLWTTFLPFVIVVAMGLIQVFVFGVLVVKRVFISNKGDVYADVVRREHLAGNKKEKSN